MGLRVTNSLLIREALADLNRVRRRHSSSQEQAASGLRINRPSDDPSGFSAAQLLRSGVDATQQYLRNISQSRTRISAVETAFADTSDLLIRARELAIAGPNGTQSAESRLQTAREVEALHDELLGIGNTTIGGAYVFAGYASDNPAFSAAGAFTDAPVAAPTVSFVGDANEIRVPIDDAVSVRVTANGERAVLGDADGDSVVDAGAEDVFDVLADLRNAFVNNDVAALRASIDRVDTALSQVQTERTRAGADLTRIDNWEPRLARRQTDLETRLSEIQEADLARVFSDLTVQETALQATLQSTSRIIQPTLLDFIR